MIETFKHYDNIVEIVKKIESLYSDVLFNAEKVKYDYQNDIVYFYKNNIWKKLCNAYYTNGESFPEEVSSEELKNLESQ
jgi:hypothetical protein